LEDRTREDEWFLKNEKELIAAARKAREKREQERAAREQTEERHRLRELHFMRCPKCGHELREETLEGIVVDKCSFCEGVYFDAGELDQFFLKRDAERSGLLKRLIGA
jgi:hypothetical protein